MSVESTVPSTDKVQLPATSRSAEAEVLGAARTINKRPTKDPYFVCDLLGENYDEARAVYRNLWKHMHPDHASNLSLTPAERKEVDDACARLSNAWKPVSKSKVIPVRSQVELAEPQTGFTEDVIIMAASFADSGLRVARETATNGLSAARDAWRRKVEDGTVDAVKAQVLTAATDLFEAGKGWFGQRWSGAVKRTGSKDTEA